MSEVALRLAELREAAELMRRAGRRIDVSLHDIQLVFDHALASGFDDPVMTKLALQYGQGRFVMDKWVAQLAVFSSNLIAAADDLERAMMTDIPGTGQPYTSSGASGRFLSVLPFPGDASAPVVSEPSTRSDSSEWFVAGVNRPVYDELVRHRDSLKAAQGHLEELTQQRQEILGDLTALKNRLLSFDREIDLAKMSRVRVMEANIARLDQEILVAKAQVTDLQTGVADLVARLERVQPGNGANLRLIAALENAETAQLVRERTEDCVNHIVNRMPIPSVLSRHAYLWDQMASQYPQYGITSGDIPLAGAVIVMEKAHSYADDVFGHLLYVERVDHGVVWVTDNLHPDNPVRLTDLTEELTGPNIQYLYFPWHTQA